MIKNSNGQFFFKDSIDDGFGIMEGTKNNVEYWISQFNGLSKTITIDKWPFGKPVEYMDLCTQAQTIYIYTHTHTHT